MTAAQQALSFEQEDATARAVRPLAERDVRAMFAAEDRAAWNREEHAIRRETVTIERLDGSTVSFERAVRDSHVLTDAQRAALDRLFAACARWDADWTARCAAAGGRQNVRPRTCAGCDVCRNSRPQTRRAVLTYGGA
jgi:hypothetical protein